MKHRIIHHQHLIPHPYPIKIHGTILWFPHLNSLLLCNTRREIWFLWRIFGRRSVKGCRIKLGGYIVDIDIHPLEKATVSSSFSTHLLSIFFVLHRFLWKCWQRLALKIIWLLETTAGILLRNEAFNQRKNRESVERKLLTL